MVGAALALRDDVIDVGRPHQRVVHDDVIDVGRPHQRVVHSERIDAVRMPAQVAGPDAAPPGAVAPLGGGSPGLVVGLVLLRLMVGAIALPGWRQVWASGSKATAGRSSWHR